VYANLSAREVCELLRMSKGYAADAVPSERTMWDILNRMGYQAGTDPQGRAVAEDGLDGRPLRQRGGGEG